LKNWHPSIRFTVAAIAANVGLLCGNAQTGTNRDLAFEVASVKQSADDRCMTREKGGPGSSDPGRVTFTCAGPTIPPQELGRLATAKPVQPGFGFGDANDIH
jgi:hypothetical protein